MRIPRYSDSRDRPNHPNAPLPLATIGYLESWFKAPDPGITDYSDCMWFRPLSHDNWARELARTWMKCSSLCQEWLNTQLLRDHSGLARTRINSAAQMGTRCSRQTLSREYDNAVCCLPAGQFDNGDEKLDGARTRS